MPQQSGTQKSPKSNPPKVPLAKTKSRIVFKRVLSSLKPYRGYVFLSIFLAVISVATQLYIPILTGQAIDLMLGIGQVEISGIIPILGTLAITAALSAIIQWLLSLSNNRITYSLSRDLRNRMMGKLQKLPLSYLDSHSSGDLVSRMIADMDTFSDGILMLFTQLFTGVITIAGILGFMLYINATITLVVVVLTPLSLLVAAYIAKRSYQYFQNQSRVRGEQTALINEMIEGQKVVQAFGYEARSQEAFDTINSKLQKITLKSIFYSSITNPATRFVNNMVYAGVGLVGALFAIAGSLSVGQLSIFLNYANQYTKPFNEISGVITELQNALACAARVFELLDEPEEVPEDEHAARLVSDGNITIDHVYFSYTPEQELIRDFNLSVKPGQKIAIVGPTGCGKTTLINLLMRFYDVTKGSISVSGIDIRKVTRASLRSNYGMVLQETWLKAGTIKENIAYGKPDATDEEIVAAAKAAFAHNFIKRMPGGYNTVISEDGGNISQGQKQLLCIARVMICFPPMLILDEATSSIDTRTEMKIQSAFSYLMRGRTSFIVAHRLSTIREADLILVMNQGRIMEQGNHDSLLKSGGFYSKLYYSQFDETPSNS
jgi:ATP-binding cassette subfamily B protein